jgi:multiple sugar transport system substrate-binding protein
MTSNGSRKAFSRRDLLRGAGGVVAFGALAACGGNTGRSSSGGGGGATISQWYHQYGEAGTEQAAKRYAQAYKKATVKVQWTPGDYASKLASGLQSNSGPDVYESQFNVNMAKSKQAVPLDDLIADVRSDYNAVDLTTNTYQGKLYGIRMIDDPQLIYYRKSMLSKAGVEPPQTLDDLVKAAKALTSKKVKGLFAGNDGGVAMSRPALVAAGADYLTAGDNPTVAFNTPDAAKALAMLHQMYADKSLLLGNTTDWTDPSAFTQGLAAMQWCGLWAMPGIQKAVGDDFGVIAFPKMSDQGKASVYSGGWTAFVSGKAKDVDAAKKFLKWLWVDNAADQEDWCLSYGFHIPPRKSLAAKAKKLQSGPAADAVKFNSDLGITDFPFWTLPMNTAWTDALNNIIRKGADPKAQLDKAEQQVKKELAKLNG